MNKITVPRVEGRNAAIKRTVSPYTIISLFLNGIVNRKDWFCSVRSDLKSTVQGLATVPSRHKALQLYKNTVEHLLAMWKRSVSEVRHVWMLLKYNFFFLLKAHKI